MNAKWQHYVTQTFELVMTVLFHNEVSPQKQINNHLMMMMMMIL